jgi:hypothetical protein
VPARETPAKAKKGHSKQGIAPKCATAKGKRLSLVVKGATTKTPRRRRKKGGWKALSGLTWSEVKQVSEFYHAALAAGLRIVFVTIRCGIAAVETDDKLCKRWLCRKIGHIRDAVCGRGKARRQPDFVACIVYEKRPGSFLHAHMLAVIARGNDALERLSDSGIVQWRPAVASDPDYISKQRLPLAPDFEAQIMHKRQASVKIAGARLSFTADAKAFMRPTSRPVQLVEAGASSVPPYVAPQATAVAPIRLPSPWPIQLGLFPADALPLCSPEAPLVEQVEAKRIQLGMTEAALARSFGMKQPHFNNVKHGRDNFGPWARRRALEFLRLAA